MVRRIPRHFEEQTGSTLMPSFAELASFAYRACFGIMVAALANASLAAETAKAPLVPIVTFLSHWDHHWYIWLPGDPVYEAARRDSGPRVASIT